jgi:hypothetical protein
VTKIDIHPLTIRIGSKPVQHEGSPAAKDELGKRTGSALTAVVTGPGGLNADVGLITWPGGSQELKTMGVKASTDALAYRGGRTTIFAAPLDNRSVSWMWVEALAPGRKNPDQPSAQTVTEAHLDWIINGSFVDFVSAHGALAFGTAEFTRGDKSRHRKVLNVAFEPDNILLPLVVFVVTRQLALVKGFSKECVDAP